MSNLNLPAGGVNEKGEITPGGHTVKEWVDLLCDFPVDRPTVLLSPEMKIAYERAMDMERKKQNVNSVLKKKKKQ